MTCKFCTQRVTHFPHQNDVSAGIGWTAENQQHLTRKSIGIDDVLWWLRTFPAAREQRPQQTELYRKSPWNRNDLDGTQKVDINLFRWLVWIRDIVHSTWRHATFMGYITTKIWPTERASSNIVYLSRGGKRDFPALNSLHRKDPSGEKPKTRPGKPNKCSGWTGISWEL